MTEEMQAVLEREMKDALAIEDPCRKSEAVITVMSHQLSALVDCQRKTSERVKALVKEKEEKAARAKGFAMAFKLARYLVASGLGAALMKFLGGAA